ALAAGIAAAQQPYTTWRSYGGGAHSSQYSALKQIDKSNVNQLEVAWTFPVGERGYTFNPVVVDRTMYVAARDNEIVALDATSGKELWSHKNEGPVSARGMNYWQNANGSDRRLLYLAAGYLTAIDAGRRHGVGRADRQAALDLPQRSASRRIRLRHLAEGRVQDRGRRAQLER